MQLLSYEDVLDRIEGSKPSLLLGNGFSRAIRGEFAYDSLFELAKESGLPASAVALFERFGTTNFEAVMRLLEDSNWIALHYNLLPHGDRNPITDDLTHIKQSLISAISHTHPPHTFSLTLQEKQSCRYFLSPFHDIFSLNYDLLLYWVSNDGTSLKLDGFGFPGNDSANPPYLVLTQLRDRRGWLFNLHGALHLYTADGETRKHRFHYERRPLIEIICEGIQKSEYPLFVAEGSAKQKLRHIGSNAYLSFCFQEFKKCQGKLVCYGLSFGESDGHIMHAIAENKGLSNLLVGLFGDPEEPHNLATRAAVTQLKKTRSRRVPNLPDLAVEYFDSGSANVWTRDL